MTTFAQKILSAFVEVNGEEKQVAVTQPKNQPPDAAEKGSTIAQADSKFPRYFDKLFSEANMPGPDYYEFAKMIEAMNTIPDERARFCAAFAGLGVQGLDKPKLLSTAARYLQLLDEDAASFQSTVDSARHEKVLAKQSEIQEKTSRLQELSGEISNLQNKISLLQAEIKESEEKIEASKSGYSTEVENIRKRILLHIEKIKEHIH